MIIVCFSSFSPEIHEYTESRYEYIIQNEKKAETNNHSRTLATSSSISFDFLPKLAGSFAMGCHTAPYRGSAAEQRSITSF